MPTDAQNLATIKSNLISALVTESANPKPSYSIDGQQVDWNGYRAAILKQITDIEALIDTESGPWEVADVMLP